MPPTRFQCVIESSAGTDAVHSLSSLAAAFHSLRRVARGTFAALLALLGLGAALAVHAQSAFFMGALQPIGTSAVTEPIAIDAQGDVWIPNPVSKELLEYTAVNGVVPVNSTPVAVAQGKFVEPSGIAFDSAGDLFVTDRSQNTIYELVAVSGSIPPSPTIKTISTSSSLNNPWGLAFDGQGNLWVANYIGSSVLELQAVSGTVPVNPAIVTYSGVSSSGTGGGGFQDPQGVWVDASGDVFVADTSNNAIKEMVAVSGSVPAPTASTPTINQLGSGFSGPTGVAVDSSGNVWVADYGNAQFKEILAVGGSIPASPTILTLTGTTGTSMNTFGVAVDAHNNVYTEQIGSLPANSLLVEIEPANFGQVYLGQGPTSGSTTSQTLTLEFGFLKYLETNAPAVYTQGFANLDYKDAGTGTCDTNGAHPAYNAGNTCTLNVAFTPLYPGTRLGAAQLYDDDGDLIATAPLLGDGVGPMIDFGIINSSSQYKPSSLNTVGSGFNFINDQNIAVDPNHNIYIADADAGVIYEATAASNYQTITTAVSPVNHPEQLALDGAGDLIWNDYGTGQVVEAQAVNGVLPPSPTLVTLASGLTVVTSLAIDGQGNVFFSDNSGLLEIEAVGGSIPASPTIRLIAAKSAMPNSIYAGALAFDQYGNLFEAPYTQYPCIYEIQAVNGQIPSSPTFQSVYCTIGIPEGLAVDAAGNLWEADFYNGLVEIQAVNGVLPASPTAIQWLTESSFGVGLDGNGNVFSNQSLFTGYPVELDFHDPPSFTWSGTTNTGQTSGTTYTAFATDSGNAPLTLEIPASGTNPSINSNWSWATGASGACPSVASGAGSAGTIPVSGVCDATISFSPITGGPLTGKLTFTDDEFYVVNDSSAASANDATQSIVLNGTALGLTAPTINWTPASPITYGTTLSSAQFNAAAFASSTNVSADGVFAYTIGTVGGTAATSSTILPAGNDQLCVQWTPSSSYTSTYSSSSLCVSITVNAATPSISWAPSSTTIIQSTGPTSGQLDATAMLNSNNITANGTLTYYLTNVGGTVISTGSSLALGPTTICAQWTPSSAYASDYNSVSTCQNFTVINTQPTTVSLASNANPVFSTYSVTLTATVTPASGTIVPTGTVTFLDNGTQIGTGTLSASGTGASAIARLTTSSLAIGSHPITATYPGDTNNQSSSTTVTLSQVVEDFSVVATGSTSATIEPGATATFHLTVSPVSPATTFPAAITLTAAGLPTGATYSFSPATINAGAGSTPVTLTVTTPITTLARNPSPAQGAKWPLMVLSLLLLPFAGKFRRAGRGLARLFSVLLLVAAGMMAAAALNGCGGIPSGYFGQAQSTSTIAVTGTSGSLSHNASLSLTVE